MSEVDQDAQFIATQDELAPEGAKSSEFGDLCAYIQQVTFKKMPQPYLTNTLGADRLQVVHIAPQKMRPFRGQHTVPQWTSHGAVDNSDL